MVTMKGQQRTDSKTWRSVIVCSVVLALDTIADFLITFIANNFSLSEPVLRRTRNTFPYAEKRIGFCNCH